MTQLSFTDYSDAMQILSELHGWTLSEQAIARGYSQIQNVAARAFVEVYDGALAKTGYYKPAEFLGELRSVHRQQHANPERTLPPAKLSFDAAMWVRLRKQLAFIKAHKDCGAEVLHRHWRELLRSPVTLEEIQALENTSLSDSLAVIVEAMS